MLLFDRVKVLMLLRVLLLCTRQSFHEVMAQWKMEDLSSSNGSTGYFAPSGGPGNLQEFMLICQQHIS
jgi:hypothetical protein